MKKVLLLTYIIVMGITTTNCQRELPSQDKNKPLIVVSICPYVSIVQAIAGESVTVCSAIQPNFDPHTMEVTPNQRALIQHAKLFIAIAEPFEPKLCTALREHNKEARIVELNEQIPALHELSPHTDPASPKGTQDNHFWLSLKRLPIQVDMITEALSQLNPEHKELYRKRANIYIERVKQLDTKLQTMLYPYQKKALLLPHSALGYFCADYNLIQIAVECEGKSPLPKDLSYVLDLAQQSDVVCAFTLPQFNNKGVEWIASKLHIHTNNIDLLEQDLLKTIEQIALFITRS